jgi:uncharacterized membrane protein
MGGYNFSMKNIVFWSFFFLFFLISPLSAQTTSGEKIQKFDAQIKINKDGTINISEKIVYDFDGLEKHGIYRTIPYIKKNQEGKLFQLDFKDISVRDEDGQPYHYTISRANDNLKIKIGDPERTITGVNTYIINYQVSGALTYFSDHDELYWNVTGNEWPVSIEKTTGKVYLPEKIDENQIRLDCYTGSYGSKETNCIYHFDYDRDQDGKSVINFSSDKYLNIGEGLTIVVGFPKNLVAILEPKEVVAFFDTIVGKIVIAFFILLTTFWYLVLPFYIIYRCFKYGRDPKATVGVTTAWFDPPKTPDGKRFMTPGEVGTLGDETVDLKDVSATIVDLARRGYLKIEERKKGDFYLVKEDKIEDDKLLTFEKSLLQEFFKSKKTISLKEEKLYQEVEEIKEKLYQEVVKISLFPESPEKTRKVYYVIAGLAMFTCNFFLALVAFIFGKNMPKKTLEGVNAFAVAKSLKNFLGSQKRQLEFQADKQLMFEKLLPYAIVFGVEKIWARRFEDLDLKPPDWYQGYSSDRFNSYLFVNSLNSSINSFRSAATPTTSSSGFSSGFSSGGGFSGGGGGGGGGGSW